MMSMAPVNSTVYRRFAAYKRPSDAASDQWVVGDYHAAPWQSDGLSRPALPVTLDLLGLYEQLLRQHLAVPACAGESLRDQLDRLSALSAKHLAAAKLESRLNAEKQFNRKVENLCAADYRRRFFPKLL